MKCLCRFVVPRGNGVGVGFVRGPAVLPAVGDNRWPWESGSFVLTGQEVGFLIVQSMVRAIRFSIAF